MILVHFVCYLLIGQIVNRSTVYLMVWLLLWKCREREDVFVKLGESYKQRVVMPSPDPDDDERLDIFLTAVINIVFWPWKELLLIRLIRDQMRRADRLLGSDSD